MNAILLAAAGVIILLVGVGAGFWIGRSGVGGSKARVEKAEAELSEYKHSVTKHFDQTATHFQAIGKQYRELYEHMATGAHALCEPGEAGKQLLFAPDADAVAEAEVRPPTDFAASPVATEAADAHEVTEETADEVAQETADEQVAEVASEAESVETATDSQPESKADVDEQTLH